MRTIVLILLMVAPSAAQDSPDEGPFSTIELRAGGSYNINRNNIHDYWRPGYGGELSLATPFYFGIAEAGGAYHRYDVADPSVPRFDAILAFAGWGIPLSPSPYVSWYNGFRLGNNRMTFDVDTFAGIRTENEFMLEVNSTLHLRLPQGLGIFGSARFSQTYTFIRFRTIYVTAGISYRTPSPRWLRTLLQ
jgi:hypothetical protein